MKTITINVPDDCEIKIIKKEEKRESIIRTYQDLINNKVKIKGFCIGAGKVMPVNYALLSEEMLKDVAISEKVAKSMLAMAIISQLMPYYGGEITKEEWKNGISKFVIVRIQDNIFCSSYRDSYCFLAFHTNKQRDEFLKYNEQLVKDYLMID